MVVNKRQIEAKRAKDVGIWIRVSTEDQAQGDSPEHHEKRARYYAESKGWHIVEVYHLEGVSGKAVSDHPETKRMLKDIERGHITGLIFSKLARLARNTRDLLEFADYFEVHKADLISLQEAIDTSTPAGRLFYTMIAAMAQWEREEIAERVAASVPIRAKLGKPIGGQATFGYQWKDGHLVPDPKEAPVRNLVYEMFLEHRRKKTAARLLNEAGYRTRNGSKFSDTTIERLLRDPTAKGIRRANYTKSLGAGKKWEIKPENEWVLSEVEAIVSEDLWNECNRILDEQQSNHKPPAKKAVQLFAGLTFCHCGDKMYVPSNTPKYTCRKCRNKIPIVDLEGIYYEQLKGFFLSQEELTSFLGEADKTIKEKQELLEVLRQEQTKAQREMDDIYDLYRNGQIPMNGFGKRYNPLQERYDQLEEQIPALEAEIDFLKINFLSSDQILSESKDLYSRWPKLKPEEKRRIVENITEQILVGQDDITINLCYLPISSELMSKGQRNLTDALPFCHFALTGSKPKPSEYPCEFKTIGDHIRQKRLDLGLFQKDVAKMIGFDTTTVFNWETMGRKPNLKAMPKIIEFLGYNPLPTGHMFGERLRLQRITLGLSQKEAAQEMGIDPSTLAHWEQGKHKPARELLDPVQVFFGMFRSKPPKSQ